MQEQYSKDGIYWDRRNAIGMGDVEQRPNLLKLIGEAKGKRILDAGCGTGYFTRKIAELGAEVSGCDVEPEMIKIAQKTEDENRRGIDYKVCDITRMLYPDKSFDLVVTVGVLFHLNRDEWQSFLNESYRVLKDDGRLLISIEHPFLFTSNSPTRSGKQCWAIHTTDVEVSYNDSAQFEEKYYKSDGALYTTKLWHHPLNFIINSIVKSGFSIKEVCEIMVEKEHVERSKYWGSEYGYPGFIQFKLLKK